MPAEAVGITTSDERAERAVEAFRAMIGLFMEEIVFPEREMRPCEMQIGILPECLRPFYSAVRSLDPFDEDAFEASLDDRLLHRFLAERIESLKWPGILLRNVQEPDEDRLLRYRIAQTLLRTLLEVVYPDSADYEMSIKEGWIVVRSGAPYRK